MTKTEKEKLMAEIDQLEAVFADGKNRSRFAEVQRPQFVQGVQIMALKKLLVSLAEIVLASK